MCVLCVVCVVQEGAEEGQLNGEKQEQESKKVRALIFLSMTTSSHD